MNLYIFEETTSTNDLAKHPEYVNGDAIWAMHQSAGRGQRGNKWSGGLGENIAFSVVLEPRNLCASDQFLISQIAALSLHDTMLRYGVDNRVKWTNDIYVGERKMAGILIENSLCDGRVKRSIVGVGLNINQLDFDPALPNPTSMRAESGQTFDREEVLRAIVESLMGWLEVIDSGESGYEKIRESYAKPLYRKGEEHNYRTADGELFRATIDGVEPHGELVLRRADGSSKGYLFREVEFVIESRRR